MCPARYIQCGPDSRCGWLLCITYLVYTLGRRGANISEDDFHKVADHTLEELADSFDALLESTDIDGSDLEYGVSGQNLWLQAYASYKQL